MFRMGKKETEPEMPQEAPPAAYIPNYAATPPPPAPGAQRAGGMMPNAGLAPNAGRAFTESETVARDIKDGNLSGYVGAGTALTGEVTFKSMLHIDGHLTGRISSETGTLIVGTSGQVDANIEVATASIKGTVNGDIVASERIEMGRAAKVFGNIQAPKLVIEDGAVFEGNCLMVKARESNEKRHAAPATKPAPAAKPEPPKAEEPAESKAEN
jgi:cytoskeletal protein CcmA (bactofilin family)